MPDVSLSGLRWLEACDFAILEGREGLRRGTALLICGILTLFGFSGTPRGGETFDVSRDAEFGVGVQNGVVTAELSAFAREAVPDHVAVCLHHLRMIGRQWMNIAEITEAPHLSRANEQAMRSLGYLVLCMT